MQDNKFLTILQTEIPDLEIGLENSSLGINLGSQFNPEGIIYPHNTEQIVKIIKLANAEKKSIYPIGSGFRFTQGMDSFQNGFLLSLKKLNKVIEYRPDNMSIEVEAGMTLSSLQEFLANDNIFFPMDSTSSTTTIGGIVAANGYGRKKYMYKSARFYVMGMEFVSPKGEVVRVGGRTIKNVSSYDVNQLLAGSWGNFGVITQITLRLKPLPQKSMLLSTTVSDFNKLISLVSNLMYKEEISLASLVMKKENNKYLLQVELEGFAETLESQKKKLQKDYGIVVSQQLLSEQIPDTNTIISIPAYNLVKGLNLLEEQNIDVFSGNLTNGVFKMVLAEGIDSLQTLVEQINLLDGSLNFKGQRLTELNRGTGYYALLKKVKEAVDPNNVLVPTSKAVKE
ncbi:MAG: FAD-binding oxidoreductase [Bacillota bacterium]